MYGETDCDLLIQVEYYSAIERNELLTYATTNGSQEDYTAHTKKLGTNCT